MKQVVHNEGFYGIGTVTIRPFKLQPDGEKEYLSVTKHNLIVEQGRGTLIDLMVGAKNKILKYIRWGKGGALQYPDGDPLNPLPVDDTATSVTTFLLDKPLSPYVRNSTTEVQYTETLICDEVDDDVNEAAMMFEDQADLSRSIFAKITFPTVRLTIVQGTGIEIKWVFTFTKAPSENVSYAEQPINIPPAN